MDLVSLPATEMRALLDAGTVSSVELVRAHLDRIDARDRQASVPLGAAPWR